MPDKIANAPVLMRGLEIFWTAYWALVSDRPPDSVRVDGNRQFTTVHFIPRASVRDYAIDHGMDADATEALHHHIRAMDVAYMGEKAHKKGSTPEAQEAGSGDPSRVRSAHPPRRR